MASDPPLAVPAREFPYHTIVTDVGVRHLAIPKLGRIVDRDIQHMAVVDYLIEESGDWIVSRIDAVTVPAIQVDFGIPSNIDINGGGRLPLFASLIADQIKGLTGMQLASVKLTKQSAQQTTLSIAEAVPARPSRAIATATVSTKRSYATPKFVAEVVISQDIGDSSASGLR